MRPALERLLARPASSGLLRALTQAQPSGSITLCRQCQNPLLRRTYVLSAAPTERAAGETYWTPAARISSSQVQELQHAPIPGDVSNVEAGHYKAFLDWLEDPTATNAAKLKVGAKSKILEVPAAWKTLAQLVAADSDKAEEIWRLVEATEAFNLPLYKRGRTPGSNVAEARASGTAMIWTAFFEMGMKDPVVMENIHQYIQQRYKNARYWKAIPRQLFLFVIEHLLLNNQSAKAIHFYDVLSPRFQPTSEELGKLLAGLTLEKSGSVDAATLKEIYIRSNIRDAYQWIITPLINREAFYDAFEWHMFLKHHDDQSPSESLSRPLEQHFPSIEKDAYYASSADRKTPLPSSPQDHFVGLEAVDRVARWSENESLVADSSHGGKDKWIARLLATRWVTLDVSIGTLHSLGVEALGPWALQAIALREPTASDLAKRIEELRQRGISIRNGAYSGALISFARRGQDDLLQALLKNDQHPSLFEDGRLQRKLVRDHEAAGDRQQAKLLRAIQLCRATDPVAESHNVELQKHALSRDYAALMRTLETMRMERIPVEVASIRKVLKAVLRPRIKGHKPDTLDSSYEKNDVNLAISILIKIMSFSHVPTGSWKEVTRRLGMVGRLDELHSLSMWLVEMYDPRRLPIAASNLAKRDLVQADEPRLKPSNEFHPFRMLFPDQRQKAIVEWSFIHGMTPVASSIRDKPELAQMIPRDVFKDEAIKRILGGVNYLKKLAQRGVYIKEINVREACYERLVILYGPGASNRVYNRAVRPYNPVALPELVHAIEQAWGRELWPDKRELACKIHNENSWEAVLPANEKQPAQIAWKASPRLASPGHDEKPQTVDDHVKKLQELLTRYGVKM